MSTSDVTYQVNNRIIAQGKRDPVGGNNTASVWANFGVSKPLGKYKVFLDLMAESTALGWGDCTTLYSRLGFLF